MVYSSALCDWPEIKIALWGLVGGRDRGETTTPSNIRQTTPLHAQSTVCDCLNAESLVFISKGCRIKFHFGDEILFGFDAQNDFIIDLCL